MTDEAQGLSFHRRDGRLSISAEDPVLATLLHEHGLLAQRDSHILAATVALAGIVAVIVGTLLLNVPDLCSRELTQRCLPQSRQWEYLFTPLPLVVLFGILMILSFLSNVNAQMLHKVERALWDKVAFTIPADALRHEIHDLPLPSSTTLASLLVSPRPARSTRIYRGSVLLLVLAVAAILLMPVLTVLARADTHWQLVALAIYGPVLLILITAFVRANLPNRQALRDAADAAVELGIFPGTSGSKSSVSALRPTENSLPVESRSFLSYLLIPRRNELLLKSVATALGMAVVQIVFKGWASIFSWTTLGTGLATIVAFDFFLYQARYTFNDIRDLAIDRTNPLAIERGRVPLGTPHAVATILSVSCLRLAGWILVAMLLGGNTRNAILGYGATVLLLWPVYDSFGEWLRRNYESSKHPSDVRRWQVVVRLLLVAPGYALRGLAGATVAYGGPLPPSFVLWLGLALAAGEGANVGLGWVLEGSADVHRCIDRYRGQIMRAPHVAWLTQRAGLITDHHLPGEVRTIPVVEDKRDEQVLLGNSSVCGPKVWNIFAATSVAASAPTGLLLASQFRLFDADAVVVAAMIGTVGGAMLLLPRPASSVLGWVVDFIAVPSSLVVAAANVALAFQIDLVSPWWAAAIPTLVGCLYQATRVSSYGAYQRIPVEILRGCGKVGQVFQRGLVAVIALLFGKSVAMRMALRRTSKQTDP